METMGTNDLSLASQKLLRGVFFAVTGNPVLHSKSPSMFNAVFQEQSMEAVYNRIAAVSVEEAMFLFRELGLSGMNVTAPFKHDIISLLDRVEIPAERIDGVNTVVREKGKLKGYNTDYIGVQESFKAGNIDTRGRGCIVLGAGGAGRAAAYGLRREKAEVTIVNRTYPKAAAAAKMFGCRAGKIEDLEVLLKSADILVSTLPADIDIIPAAWLRKEIVVFDANYKKSFLLEKAQKVSCRVIKGEEWLLNQAISAYRYFLGKEPGKAAVETMRGALLSPPAGKPKNIALVGFMGSGKTVTGKLLAAKMGFPFQDIDDLVEAEEGRRIAEIFKTDGEDYFRKIETAILKRELAKETAPGVVYGCGGGVVLDEKNKIILKENALVIWLYSSIPTTLQRLEPGTGKRPLLACPNPGKKAGELLDQRMIHYARAADLIVSSEKSAEAAAERIYEEIAKTFGH